MDITIHEFNGRALPRHDANGMFCTTTPWTSDLRLGERRTCACPEPAPPQNQKLVVECPDCVKATSVTTDPAAAADAGPVTHTLEALLEAELQRRDWPRQSEQDRVVALQHVLAARPDLAKRVTPRERDLLTRPPEIPPTGRAPAPPLDPFRHAESDARTLRLRETAQKHNLSLAEYHSRQLAARLAAQAFPQVFSEPYGTPTPPTPIRCAEALDLDAQAAQLATQLGLTAWRTDYQQRSALFTALARDPAIAAEQRARYWGRRVA